MIRINLLPTKAAKKKESVIQQAIVGVIVISAVFAGIFVVHNYKSKEIEAQRIENNRLQQEINQLATIIAEVENYKKKKQDRNNKIQVIKKLNDGRSGPVKMLDEFTYTLPDKLWIEAFKEKGGNVEIQGTGLTGGVIADFVENLRNSKYFSNVNLLQTQLREENQIEMQQFKVTLVVNYSAE